MMSTHGTASIKKTGRDKKTLAMGVLGNIICGMDVAAKRASESMIAAYIGDLYVAVLTPSVKYTVKLVSLDQAVPFMSVWAWKCDVETVKKGDPPDPVRAVLVGSVDGSSVTFRVHGMGTIKFTIPVHENGDPDPAKEIQVHVETIDPGDPVISLSE